MLTQAERNEIERELEKFPSKRDACIEAMTVVQRHRGVLSDQAVRDVAGILELDPAEVFSVASFYNLLFRRVRGRHVIWLCDSATCWMLGRDQILGLLTRRLGVAAGETTPDGRFTLLPIVCLGACDHAPTMMIDDDLHRDVGPNDLDGILARYP